MSNIDKQALRIPERKKHNWGQAVMRDCDFCQQWALTVRHSDGGCICASCCDSEYTTELSSALVVALDELEAAEKRIAELSGEFFALPPLNDELIAILGRPNFTCAHLAELLRKGGQDIGRKAECEQAAVIYWFLDLYLKYGDKWESIAKDDIQSRVAMITAGTAKGE